MSCFTQLDTITILASNWPKINILASNWPKITILASNWPKINVLASNWPKINVLGLWLVAECQSEYNCHIFLCLSSLLNTPLMVWASFALHDLITLLGTCTSSWPQDHTGTMPICDDVCKKSSPWPPCRHWRSLALWEWGNDCLSSFTNDKLFSFFGNNQFKNTKPHWSNWIE